MKHKIVVNGVEVEFEATSIVWREIIRASSGDGVQKVARALDEKKAAGPLLDDEEMLRKLIKEERGI